MGYRSFALVAGLVLAIGACTGSNDAVEVEPGAGTDTGGSAAAGVETEARVAAFVALPDGAAAEAARALVGGGDTNAVIARTRDVLRRGRVSVLAERQLLGFAFDARRRAHQYRLDSAELAQMLEAFGFPFGDGYAGSAADTDRAMIDAIAAEDADAFREEVEAYAIAETVAAEARRRDAEARHRAERDAITQPAEARREETARLRDGIARERSAAPREQRAQFDERLEAATRERDAARAAASEARERAKALDDAFRLARERDDDRIERSIRGRIGPDRAAGSQLMARLGEWVREAARNPDAPESFTPLFLAEMARRQADPVDLAAAEAVDPVRHKWSLLELALFAAAFRPDPEVDVALASQGAATHALDVVADLLVPIARADDAACDVAKGAWGDWSDVAGVANAEATGAVIGEGARRAFGDAGSEAFGQMVGAASILGKVVKLAAFYAEAQVTVEHDQSGVVHKPEFYWHPVVFTARAGVSEEELKAYEEVSKRAQGLDRELRACLGWLGLPTRDTIGEVAKDAENWILDWRLYGNGHADWAKADNQDATLYGNGRIGKPMARVSASSAESRFKVRVQKEGAHRGALGTGEVWVRAEVDSSSLPSLGTLVGAGKGPMGIADAVVDLASGWIRVVFKPKSSAMVPVEFHCRNPTTIHRYVKNPVADGRGSRDDGCTFAFDSKKDFEEWRARHYPDG